MVTILKYFANRYGLLNCIAEVCFRISLILDLGRCVHSSSVEAMDKKSIRMDANELTMCNTTVELTILISMFAVFQVL